MKFSIIIPAYNASQYIERCLNSIQSQSYPFWECILVDDGSTDDTGRICDAYSDNDNRFQVIHLSNGGVSKARNVGLDYATCDWITFCDSDDELMSDALLNFTEGTNRYPAAQMLRGGHTTITLSGRSKDRVVETWYSTTNHADALKLSEQSYCSGFIWSTAIRRNIIQKIRFDEDIMWCEDHIFTYRCMANSNLIVFIPYVVYKYYLDDTYPIGYGRGLSYKVVDYRMAIRSAEVQRSVKLVLAGEDKQMQLLVDNQFKASIRLACYYAFFKCSLFSVKSYFRDYSFLSMRTLFRIYCSFHKTRLKHVVKTIFSHVSIDNQG